MNERAPSAEPLPTLEMVNGVLKSRPPTRRNPHGEGPLSVTVWGMFGGSTTGRESGVLRALVAAFLGALVPGKERNVKVGEEPCLAARQRRPVRENFPPLPSQV